MPKRITAQSGIIEFITDEASQPVVVNTDGGLRVTDGTDANFLDFIHDGTDFNITGTNTTDINFTGITTLKAGAGGGFIADLRGTTGHGYLVGGAHVGIGFGTGQAGSFSAYDHTNTYGIAMYAVDTTATTGVIDALGTATDLDFDGWTSINVNGAYLDLQEIADPAFGAEATRSKLWVQDTTPNQLMFTDDAGNDIIAASLANTVNISGTPVDNQIAVWTNANTLEGDANLTWDGTTLQVAGGAGFHITATYMGNANSLRSRFLPETPTATNPNIIPRGDDADTGIAWAAADQLSLVAGGVEVIRFTEASSSVIQTHEANVGLTADVGSAQGNGVITSTYNVYSTVANPGDAATLPSTFPVGTIIYVKNDGINPMDVFPASGDDAGEGVDAPVVVQSNSSVTFIATAADSTWTPIISSSAGAVSPVYEIDVNDTFDVANAGKVWHKDSGAAVTFTCANDPSIQQGTMWLVHNDDAEDLTIAQGTGVTISFLASGSAPVTGNVTVEQGGFVTVYKYTDTEYWVWGDDGPFNLVTAGATTDSTLRWDGTSWIENTSVQATSAGSLYLAEQADASADIAGYGQLWVDLATPNVLYFTDDAGTDFPLTSAAGGGNVFSTGTPADNQVAVWTATSNTIEGDANFTWDGTLLRVGPSTGINLIIDGDSITADNNGASTPLYLQDGGSALGDIYCWNANGAGNAGTLFLRKGGDLEIYENADSDFIRINHSGSDGRIYTNVEPITFYPDATLSFTIRNTELQSEVPLFIEEAASAVSDIANYGQVWVQTETPNRLMFTDDSGQDIRVTPNQATVQTTDATQTEIISISVASGTTFGYRINIVGNEAATGDTVFESIFGAIHNQGGTTAIVGSDIVDRTEDTGAAAWVITVAADDTTDALTVDVTGEASHTIDWKVSVEILDV